MSQYTFVTDLDREKFDGFAASSLAKSHFLGSYEWGQVSARRGWTPHYVGMEKDGQLAATALLLQKKLFLGYSYFYIPRGFSMDYKNIELLQAMTKAVDQYCKKHGSIYFMMDPDIKYQTIDLDGQPVEGEENHALVKDLLNMGYKHKGFNYFFEHEQPRYTFRVDLNGSIEEIEGRYGRSTKNLLKQAAKNDVEVYIGTRDDIKEFTRLMAMTEKRQDFFSHDPEYYYYFYDILHAQGMVDLYLARLDVGESKAKLNRELEALQEKLEELKDATSKKAMNRKRDIEDMMKPIHKQLDLLSDKPDEVVTVSAYLLVKYQDKVWTLYAANDMDYLKFYGNYKVYRQLIVDAQAQGYKTFDVFGTIGKPDSDSNLAGLFEFKKKWGGEYTEFIGEFDYIENKLMHMIYKKLIPIYHNAVNKKLRKQVQQHE